MRHVVAADDDAHQTRRTGVDGAPDGKQVNQFEEAKTLLRKMMPVARRVLGENHADTLRLRWNYADALYNDPGATLDDLREAVTTLEDIERISRRVFGGAHSTTTGIGGDLQPARAALRARETPSPSENS